MIKTQLRVENLIIKYVSLHSMIDGFPEKSLMLMQLHYSRLSEKGRRQYAALESLKLGRGGTTYISKVLGVDRKTILQGIKELKEELLVFTPSDRQRKKGGGRKKNGSNSGDKRVADRIN
ncbi:MAG: hypothetical protein WCI92_16370 [Bacteroidota bacterium]